MDYTPVQAEQVEGRCVPSEFLCIQEAQGLTWDDDFFDEDEGIVAVFDFDYHKMVKFQSRANLISGLLMYFFLFAYLALVSAAGGLIVILIEASVVFGIYMLTLAPCLFYIQSKWAAEAHHVAITRDGIRYVQSQRKSCWGLSVCDRGKHSKTVPFDKITDCDITEPAGSFCLIIPRILYQVNIDTASSSAKKHELVLEGLKEPHLFKAFVWAMKRHLAGGTAYATSASIAPIEMEMTQRHSSSHLAKMVASESSTNQDSTNLLASMLREIRDEMRQNNELLRKIHANGKGDESPQDLLNLSPATTAVEAIISATIPEVDGDNDPSSTAEIV